MKHFLLHFLLHGSHYRNWAFVKVMQVSTEVLRLPFHNLLCNLVIIFSFMIFKTYNPMVMVVCPSGKPEINSTDSLPWLQLSCYKSKDLETDCLHSLFNFTRLAFFGWLCNHITGEKICLLFLHLCFFEKYLAKVYGIFGGKRGELQLGLHHCDACGIVFVIHSFYRTKVLCHLDMQVNCN